MNGTGHNENAAVVLGQKYAFVTVALVLAMSSFVSLLGMEKSILAIIFAWMALRREPAPPLSDRRRWGRVAIVLGVVHVVVMSSLVLFNLDRIRTVLEMLMTLEGK